jgi:FkbM family methyltransferase
VSRAVSAAVRRRLRAFCPPPLRRWRERRYFLRTGEIELRIVPLLCRRDRDGIDVGANEGAYLHAMIPHARQVIAFEPIPELAASLARKFGTRVVIHPIALSCAAGTATLRIPIVQGSSVTGLASLLPDPVATVRPHDEIAVQTQPLDAIYGGDVGFIKIDVEGHEEAVLDGAAATIARCRPRLLVEMEERFAPGVIDRGCAWFARMGYRGFYIHDRRVLPLEGFDPQALQQARDVAEFVGAAPRASLHDYVNNFLFLPAEESAELARAIGTSLARGG